jgi:uncharacterized protein YdeI (YjbR/CyaY-like superfamily)
MDIVLESQLKEELKWKVPCFTFRDNIIVLMHAFKEYCALAFLKGNLLNETNCILIL